MSTVPDGYEFAVCLTHDVDRPYKTFQAPYYALKERNLCQLTSLMSSERPYWQFDEIMELEEELDVRSSFYFLNEQSLFRDRPVSEWVKPKNWKLYTGRYDITDPEIVDVIKTLDQGGWEIGLHGSYNSYNDVELLCEEIEQLEKILGHEVLGGRQHYLNLNRPETWECHKQIGLSYDCSLGSSSEVGFQYGYEPYYPFEDDFMVIPLTIMEIALLKDREYDEGWEIVKSLLSEARQNNAVMNVLWHPRYFSDSEYEAYKRIYRNLILEAKEMGGWVGDCKSLYNSIKQ